ncbi:hypothetical protein ACHJH3_06715 [Campylobacter sp. MOP7]|uniref:hypothetical protein n=1 Tax=Campylobacter canis TaxID=3378588 RepID=UPI00387E34C3
MKTKFLSTEDLGCLVKIMNQLNSGSPFFYNMSAFDKFGVFVTRNPDNSFNLKYKDLNLKNLSKDELYRAQKDHVFFDLAQMLVMVGNAVDNLHNLSLEDLSEVAESFNAFAKLVSREDFCNEAIVELFHPIAKIDPNSENFYLSNDDKIHTFLCATSVVEHDKFIVMNIKDRNFLVRAYSPESEDRVRMELCNLLHGEYDPYFKLLDRDLAAEIDI